jgi:hypothetical protein
VPRLPGLVALASGSLLPTHDVRRLPLPDGTTRLRKAPTAPAPDDVRARWTGVPDACSAKAKRASARDRSALSEVVQGRRPPLWRIRFRYLRRCGRLEAEPAAGTNRTGFRRGRLQNRSAGHAAEIVVSRFESGSRYCSQRWISGDDRPNGRPVEEGTRVPSPRPRRLHAVARPLRLTSSARRCWPLRRPARAARRCASSLSLRSDMSWRGVPCRAWSFTDAPIRIRKGS